jgi:hypothetical protein
MDFVVLVMKVAAMVLVLYGGWLCLWQRVTERASEERAPRSPRHLRLISEMGEAAANEPLKKAA